jgi:hypothetical protein
MHERFLHMCLACGGDVLASIKHIMPAFPRWECHRRNYGTLAQKLQDFVRHFATYPKDINI